MAEIFMPHGMCFMWRTDVLLLHVLSDAAIALAYFSIPLAIAYFVRRRTDLEYKWVFVLFAAFIVACGVTHMLGIWVVWNPDYFVEGTAKAVTAAVSVATAILLWPLLPKLLALPAPSELRVANESLHKEIARRQRAQAELEVLNRELERRVTERTLALQRSNEDLEKFAYHVSHDLKAPLRAVSSLSQFIEEDLGPSTDAELGENLELMRKSVRRMEQMLDDLLQYSRIGKGENGDENQFSIDALIADAIDLASPPATFEVNIDSGLADVKMPRIPLLQVLLNLISNAAKHHDGTAGRIDIVARQNAGRYSIEVRDDGPGISPQHHNDIFELFRTLKPRSEGSSGMGLAIAKRAMERVDGEISVQSDGHRGTSFTISWPV